MKRCKDILSTIYGEHGIINTNNQYACECFTNTIGSDRRIGTFRFRSLSRAKRFAIRYTKSDSNNFCRVWEDLPPCVENEFIKGWTFKESYRNGKCIARSF